MASKTPINCSIAIGSTLTDSDDVCNKILSQLEAIKFSQDDVFAVHLAIEEAILNAIKHGNKMDPDKEIKIDYSINPHEIEISVTDEGKGFDPNAVPDPRCGENLYKTEGRGIFLIRAYMDLVEFNKQGNRVRMVKYKSKQNSRSGSRDNQNPILENVVIDQEKRIKRC